MIKRFIVSHRFFVATSPGYVDESGWKYWRYFPIAYCKFMWFMLSQPPMFDPLDEATVDLDDQGS